MSCPLEGPYRDAGADCKIYPISQPAPAVKKFRAESGLVKPRAESGLVKLS